ncbi:MAG: AMIN domain-containing protein [Bacillota bacterium]|nr:MAG: AMIN domain-containing protein [Bacillota bacterium]
MLAGNPRVEEPVSRTAAHRLTVAICLVAVLLTGLVPATGSGAVAAAGDITLVINGRVAPSDVPPILVDGRVLVPIRIISQNLGAEVEWIQATSAVVVRSGGATVVVRVGLTQATVNGQTVFLDVPARVESGRTMVPIRFISQALGAAVDWRQATREVIVNLAREEPAIEGLSWEETPGVARFVIVTNGPVRYDVSTRAAEPLYPNDRLLVEVDKSVLNIPDVIHVGKAGVEKIRSYVMESAPLTRVIFDCDEAPRYTAWATWDPSPPLGLGDLPAVFEPGQQAIVVEIQYKVLGVEYVDEPGAERVVVRMNGPADYRVWEASDPWRVVVDARRATLGQSLEGLSNAQRTRPIGELGFTQARFAQFNVDPDVARVVLDAASGPAPYHVSREGNDLVIYLGGTVAVTGFGYETLDRGGRFSVWAGRSLRPTVTRSSNPERLTLHFPGVLLAGPLGGGGTVTYDDQVVASVTYAQDTQAQATTFTLSLKGPVSVEATTTDDGVVVDLGRSPVSGKLIVIDPGHGGNDPGAIAANGTREANLTLQIGLKLADLLRAAGADVRLTRTTAAENPDKYARPQMANDAGADALVSIHLNANYRSTICGSECYYYQAQSRPLAETILSHLLDELGRPDGGVRWADFVVTREARMPACLVEALYMSNPTDLAVITAPGTPDRIAGAVFEGLEDYFASH